jgi:SAM-dependent methyltransferase
MSRRLVLALLLFLLATCTHAEENTYKQALIDKYPFYQTATGRFAPVYPALARQIVDDYGITKGVCVDVGGGCGSLAMELAKITDLTVYVLDIDPFAARLCNLLVEEAGLTGRVRAVEGDAQHMPFRDGFADLVVSRGSIFFWPDQFASVKECYRILKPGGVAFVGGCLPRGLDPQLHDSLLAFMQAKQAHTPDWHAMDTQGILAKAQAEGLQGVKLVSDRPHEWWLEMRK